MNILYEIDQQPGTNTIMLIPSIIPEAGVPLIGMYGLKEIGKMEGKKSKGRS